MVTEAEAETLYHILCQRPLLKAIFERFWILLVPFIKSTGWSFFYCNMPATLHASTLITSANITYDLTMLTKEGWSSQLIFQFKQLERRSLEKKSGLQFNEIRTGAMLYQLSYEAKHWERGHGFESRWSPDFFFQASSFQLLKLENELRWSLFNFIYNRSSNMNYLKLWLVDLCSLSLFCQNRWEGIQIKLFFFQLRQCINNIWLHIIIQRFKPRRRTRYYIIFIKIDMVSPF